MILYLFPDGQGLVKWIHTKCFIPTIELFILYLSGGGRFRQLYMLQEDTLLMFLPFSDDIGTEFDSGLLT